MADSPEDEIYSTMFNSLKHPVRRKILRILGERPMTFTELVDELGVSSPHLTYHLESLGELITKKESGKYKLSSFGLASVSAMKGVEDVREVEPKKSRKAFKGKVLLGALLAMVVLLASMSAVEYVSLNQMAVSQQSLAAETQQLVSWGIGTDKVANFVRNVTHIDTRQYTVSSLSNTMKWRTDFGGVAEEEMHYSLTSPASNLNIDFRFRNGHFSRYALTMIESSPIFTQVEPYNVLQNARGILGRYKVYSGDAYITDMINILDAVNATTNTVVTQGNMKLDISVSGGTVVLFWMYTEGGIDYQAKGLQMTFQNSILTIMTDGYFLFTVGSTSLSVTKDQAVNVAKNYIKTLSWTIEGSQVSGFTPVDPPLSVQLVPHTRGNSVALIPYYYVEIGLDKTYAGGYNEFGIGIYGDTGQVANVQMLSGSIETQPEM